MQRLALLTLGLFVFTSTLLAQADLPSFNFKVTMPEAAAHRFHVELTTTGWKQDTVRLKMPKWSPGYYQILNYADAVENFAAADKSHKSLELKKNDNGWTLKGVKGKTIVITYDVKAEKKFVAQNYADTSRAYLIPAGLFVHADGFLQRPSTVTVDIPKGWTAATGLDNVPGKANEFTAPDFDILYDCPILLGKLDELPSFKVKGVEHRFLAYKPGNFDRADFMDRLRKIVEASVAVIGDIPYKRYTFIGIPGRGGIEHLNNTTLGFNGTELQSPGAMNRVMNFFAHEYFHHYNVKRIRPFELGPFDYDRGSRTNLLWVSEGISVYYEYMVVKRAGLADEQTLFHDFEGNINATENNPGRLYQSLAQASYKTWSDGPFGTQGEDAKKSISYYDKGPVVGLLLDFAIRHATQNKKSLDDVMRRLYWHYYKELQRGFTDAEFQQTCEETSGVPLTNVFEYVYTTKDLDYNTLLAYAGLAMDVTDGDKGKKFSIRRLDNPDALQAAILKSWLGD